MCLEALNVEIEGVIIFDARSGLPLFSKLKGDIDPSLFSGFIAAIGHFSNELKLGGLSSFSTEEKVIFLAPHDKIVTALVAPKKPEYQQAYVLAKELGKEFSSKITIRPGAPPEANVEFAAIVDEFMRRIRHPFISQAADFLHKKYGGEVSIKARMMRESGTEDVMDILINLGVKNESEKNGKKRPLAEMLSENFIFCKVIDGRISRAEVIDFVESLGGYGARIFEKEELKFVPYYPSRAIIIAREFSPEAIEFLRKLPKRDNKPMVEAAMFSLRKESFLKCPLDLYEWRENGKPDELILD